MDTTNSSPRRGRPSARFHRPADRDVGIEDGGLDAIEYAPDAFTGAGVETTTTVTTDASFVKPKRVDRRPLSYDLFAYFVSELEGLPLATTRNLALAFGVRVYDVTRARQAWRRHLERNGQECPRCGSAMDPAFFSHCSRACVADVQECPQD